MCSSDLFPSHDTKQVIIPEKLECLGFEFWLSGYFSTSEIEALRQELQEAYDKGGENLFNPREGGEAA